jgi:hypothetical protein
MCRLSAIKTCSTWTSWPLKVGPIGYPKMSEWNYHFMLCTIPEYSSLKTCSISACHSTRRTPNGGIYIYSVILLQKMSTRVKSHDLAGQGISPTLSTQHLCNRFKSFIIYKNDQTRGFQLLIPHEQNPHREINQLAVTAKKLSQPGIVVCGICSCSFMADCHGLHGRLPWLVQHSCLIWTQITLVIRQRLEKYSSYITVQWPSHPASKCMFSNRRHCSLSACSPTMWL